MKSTVVRLSIAAFVSLLLLSACGAEGVNGMPEPRPAPIEQIASGRRLIASYGCGTCHMIPGVPGADGHVGPPLDHFYERMFIAGMLTNNEDNLVKWIEHPQQVVPGNDMPEMGVSEQQARDIAAYLYHKPTLRDWLDR